MPPTKRTRRARDAGIEKAPLQSQAQTTRSTTPSMLTTTTQTTVALWQTTLFVIAPTTTTYNLCSRSNKHAKFP